MRLIILITLLLYGSPQTFASLQPSQGGQRGSGDGVVANFRASLHMKDSVDFLLAPGISLRDALRWRHFIDGLEPKRSSGSKGVTCDVVILLNSPDRVYPTTLFAKCWATEDWYQIVVQWAEPHGRGLYFSTYPPTLKLRSDLSEFAIEHALLHGLTQSYEKPFGFQRIFTNMFGDYPIANIRFSDESPIDPVLAGLNPSRELQLLDGSCNFALRDSADGTSNRVVAVSAAEGFVRNFKVFKHPDDVSYIVNFEFSPTGEKKIIRQRTFFPQGIANAGVPNGAITVSYRGKASNVDALPIVINAGGKWRSLNYINTALRNFHCNLPTKIEEESGSQVVLRTANLLNFEEFDPSEIRCSEAEEFTAFTSMDMSYRDVLVRNWKRKQAEISREDRANISRLQQHYEELSTKTSTGERFKHLNVQMELSRLDEDMPRLRSLYKEFLTLLSESLNPDAASLSGYNQIDVLVLWGRFEEATDLFRLWKNWITHECPPKAFKLFAQREMKKGNWWPIYMLIESAESEGLLSSLNSFENAAVRAIAMSGVKELLEFPQRFRQDESKMSYRSWILSMTTVSEANRRFYDSLSEALCYSQQLTHGEVTDEEQQLLHSLSNLTTAHY